MRRKKKGKTGENMYKENNVDKEFHLKKEEIMCCIFILIFVEFVT